MPTGWQKSYALNGEVTSYRVAELFSATMSDYFRSLDSDAMQKYVAKLEAVGLTIHDDLCSPWIVATCHVLLC